MKTLLLFIGFFISIAGISQDVIKTHQIKLNKCNLLDKPYGSIIIPIKKGEEVNALDIVDGFYKVTYKNEIGYILDIFIYDADLQDTLKQRSIKKKESLDKKFQEKLKAEQENKAFEELQWKAKVKKMHEEAEQKNKRENDEYIAKIKQFKDDSIKIENEHKRFVAQAKLNEENRKKQLIEKYGTEKAKLIIARKVYIGMTAGEAKDSWGNPSDINRTITINKTREQWVYGNRKYLYFENGVLTTIQE